MSPQLPKPEDILSAVMSFPPKISAVQSLFSIPEEMFESTVKSMTKMEIPPGPNKMLVSFMKGFEASLPAAPAGLPAGLPLVSPPGGSSPSGGGVSPQGKFELK
jgi:hypothetical protein